MTIRPSFATWSLPAAGLLTMAVGLMAAETTAAPTPAPSPQAAILLRQAGFKKMGSAMKALNEQLKDAAPAKDVMVGAARTIEATAREQGPLFPVGSGPAPGVKTEALANIWTDRATFDAGMAKMVVESGKLVAIADTGDVAAIQDQTKATGATCGGCHRQFRAPD